MSRISAPAARRCFDGQHLWIAGDSVSRYVYTTLAHFLVRGSWPAPGPGWLGAPSLTYQPDWGTGDDWEAYFAGSSAMLLGRETCNCHRGPAMSVENRRVEVPGGGTVSFTFVPRMNDWTFGGHDTADGDLSRPLDWTAPNASSFISEMARRRNGQHGLAAADAMVLNIAAWSSSEDWGESDIGELLDAAYGAARLVVWRETTQNRDGTSRRDARMEAAVSVRGHEYLGGIHALTDALRDVRPSPFLDMWHMHPFVYQAISKSILRGLCG